MNNLSTDFKCANYGDVENIMGVMKYGYHKCWDKKFFSNLIENKNSFLYIQKNKEDVVGFVAGTISEKDCDIIMMVIDVKSRRNGFGSLLLKNILHVLRDMGITNIYLEVAVNNSPAVNLYEKCGFEKINIRKSYYKHDDKMIDAALYQMVNI